MKRFIVNNLTFFSPFILLFFIMVVVDPFKVFYNYENYYEGENDVFDINRGVATTGIYLNHYKDQQFNAFILGSSRVFSYSCEEWAKYLPQNAKPFHFNGLGEGIYDIRNKLVFIDQLKQPVKHVLLAVDRDLLTQTKNKGALTSISPPILSGESPIDFYSKYINAFADGHLVLSYLDYSMFKTYRPYMENYILGEEHPDYFSNVNASPLQLGYEEEIAQDSIEYYEHKQAAFRMKPYNAYHFQVKEQEIEYLNEIKAIFEKHQTNYKIVVNPLYDQIPLNKKQLRLLEKIFGSENIYNYSGKNEITRDKGNFHDASHYRVSIANKILKEIYSKN